jgi:FixJ family two-component response regulator
MKESEPRVFVVVDNRSVRTSIADVLMTEGYVVEKFASAAEYLARTPYPCPVCIILEAQLPGFDSLASNGSSRRSRSSLSPGTRIHAWR